jgi:hypothetical protein
LVKSFFPVSKAELHTEPDGSRLCLACGLCCESILHAHANVNINEIDLVRALGLDVENINGHLGFRLPCPLYQNNCCSVYTARRPDVCGAFQCDLLKKYLAGAITCKQGTKIVKRTHDLLANVLLQMPADYSFTEVKRKMEQEWDSGSGAFGSAEMHLNNPGFLIALGTLILFSNKYFGKPKDKAI